MNGHDYQVQLHTTSPSLQQHQDGSGLPGEEDPFWMTPVDVGVGAIGEREMKRAFDQIVNCIHLDDEECVPHGHKDRTTVPDLDSPQSSTSSRISFTSQGLSTPSNPLQCALILEFSLTPSISIPSISPLRRVPRPNLDPPLINSPIPLSTKSFLDDDWLRDRVKHDSKMAQVAGGLVRSSSTPPRSDDRFFGANFCNDSGSFASHFNNNPPPQDYICKLCNIPGHWLKDCHLYEPRGGNMAGNWPSHSRTASVTSIGSRAQQPPGNYICRLCGVPGHWIEHCSKFQPKLGKSDIGMKGSIPPKNYICNLCHRPGHWIQQCSDFTPMPSSHKRSS